MADDLLAAVIFVAALLLTEPITCLLERLAAAIKRRRKR